MANWLNFIRAKPSLPYNEFPKILIKDSNEGVFEFDNDKVYLVNIWSTSCAPCIKKFPDYEKLFLQYKDDPSIEVVTLNLPFSNDYMSSMQYTKSYDFTALSATKKSSWKNLSVKAVPLYIVLGKENKIAYHGQLNLKWYEFYNNIHKVIEHEKNKN